MPSRSMTPLPGLFKPSPTRWEPRAIQKRGMRFLLEHHPGAGLLFDPGLGKTSCTLGAIKVLKKKGLRPKALVIAPIRVMAGVWPDEIAKWLDFQDLSYVVLHGPKKEQLLQQDVDLYLINPEGLDWLFNVTKVKEATGKKAIAVDLKRVRQCGFNLLVVDELTKFKNHASDRFKAMKQVLPLFPRRWGLTGTPAARYLEPLFGQVYVLDQGAALGRYITHYRAQFFDQGFDGFTYTAKDGAEEQIYARLANVALRADAKDHLDLPELVETQVVVDLPESARAVYHELENDLLALVGKKLITAKNSAVAAMKCRQVTAGAIYLEPGLGALGLPKGRTGREWVELHTAKLDAAEDLLEELQGSPAIVAYEFQHDYERLQARLGGKRPLPHIGRGVGLAEGKRVQDAWNAGDVPVLLAHAGSISHGLNLQHAGNHVLWYTLTWDYELYDQLIRRLLRQGSKHQRVFSHALVARGTIDEHVWASIAAKKDCQNRLFEALKRLQGTRSKKS